jgi:elongator complex protein 6
MHTFQHPVLLILKTMSNRIPPLLAPYLALSQPSFILLSSVLGASANWLVLRYLYSALVPPSRHGAGDDAIEDEKDIAVVFVSFMREWGFWSEGSKKLVHRAKIPSNSFAVFPY